jgi:hypothetical protein
MTRLPQQSELVHLQRCWQRWSAVVELFAFRRPGRRGIKQSTYKTLHRELLEACQDLEATASGKDKTNYHQMSTIARPWLSVQALARADHLILLSLRESCQTMGREIGAPRERTWHPRLGALLIMVFVVAALCFLVPVIQTRGEIAWAWLERVVASFQYMLRVLNIGEKVFLAGLVVVGISLYLVMRIWRGA